VRTKSTKRWFYGECFQTLHKNNTFLKKTSKNTSKKTKTQHILGL